MTVWWLWWDDIMYKTMTVISYIVGNEKCKVGEQYEG